MDEEKRINQGYGVIDNCTIGNTEQSGIQKKYDCLTCPYPRYKSGHIIFCDVCMLKILEEQRGKKI